MSPLCSAFVHLLYPPDYLGKTLKGGSAQHFSVACCRGIWLLRISWAWHLTLFQTALIDTMRAK